MKFSLNKSLELLENTPEVVSVLLQDLSNDWINQNEGENTWTVKEVVAHLILCEETDWLPRIRIILSTPELVFKPIDMQAHFQIARSNSLKELLVIFKQLRESGIKELKEYNLKEIDFFKTGIHPVNGAVTLQEVIATWVTHDLSHISQLARILAKQNMDLVGSFKQYLKILNQ